MTRIYSRTMKWCGAAGVLVAVAWVSLVAMGHTPPIPDKEYVTSDPTSGVFHDPEADCIFVDPGKALARFPGRKAALAYGDPCPNCISVGTPTRKASLRRHTQTRLETAPPQRQRDAG